MPHIPDLAQDLCAPLETNVINEIPHRTSFSQSLPTPGTSYPSSLRKTPGLISSGSLYQSHQASLSLMGATAEISQLEEENQFPVSSWGDLPHLGYQG